MRISDWSSDVCSSDLHLRDLRAGLERRVIGAQPHGSAHVAALLAQDPLVALGPFGHQADHRLRRGAELRSEERSVGNECVSKCRSRGSANHSKKKQMINYV